MKLIFMLIFIANLSTFLFSQQYQLNLKLHDGTVVTYDLNDIDKITFSDISTAISNPNKINYLKTFILFQNHPNPFNPTTNISFSIPQSGIVDILIFDVSGKLINKMQKHYSNSGVHEIEWDAKNKNGIVVSSGLYLYQVKFKSEIISKKMIFIK